MAVYDIYRIRIGSSALIGDPTNYPTGSIVRVQWNDGTEDFQVDVYSADTYVSTETTGPDLTADDYTEVEYGFQFCDSSTLVTFRPNYTLFPYAVKVETANAAQCALNHVCDILVTDVTVTKASSSVSSDGVAVIVCEGAGDSPFVYSLNSDFSSSQTSATFSGLSPGNYTVYAKSSLYPTCKSSKDFVVGFTSTYGVRYRGDFDSPLKELEGYKYRVDILERDFVDALTEVKTGATPFVVHYQGETEDKYKSVIASKATIQLISQSDFYFIDLFTGDERQFQVKFYINDGGGYDLEWMGYLLQQGYEEEYMAAPYPVTLIATDGLADLSQIDYSDVGDKSIMNIISQCISETDLGINIRCGVNIYEANHDATAADDPLNQTYFDTYFLTEKNKLQVLEEILKPFGARIFQSQAKWWIIRIEDSITSSLAYREFTQAGVYSSNSTENLQKFIDYPDITSRSCWVSNPLLRIRSGYKKVVITHDLGLENNIFFEGRFHIDDFNDLTGLFSGFGLELGSSLGVDYGLESTRNGESEHCLFVDFSNATVNTGIVVFTEDKTVDSDNFLDYFKLSFDYLISVQTPAPFIRFNWMIDLSSSYVNDNPFTNHTNGYNTVYADQFFSWQKYEQEFGPVSTTTMQVKLNLLSNNIYDASSLAALELLDTDLLNAGERRTCLDTIDGDNYLRIYTLNYTTDAHFSPDIIEPDDYGTSNKKWFLNETLPFSSAAINPVGFYLIDNLRVSFYPDGQDPEEDETYEVIINDKNKEPYEVDVIFGDLPDVGNAVHIYKNYFKLSDGTPTALWSRTSIAESETLLQILAEDMAAQNVIGIRLMSGSLTGDQILRYHYGLLDTNDSNRAFINMGLEIDYRMNNYAAEIIEIKTTDGEPPGDSSEFSTAFSLAFKS